ncbi:hypothetical protein Tco_0024805, partial [Tanacetum coccineum]
AAKFVRDFKSLAKEADESLVKHKALELEIERLLRAVVSQDIMSVVQNNSIVDTSNLQTELERKQMDTTKGTSVNTQFRKQSILGKPPSSSGSKLYSVTPLPKSKVFPKVGESNALSKPFTLNSAPSSRESTVVNNERVIAPGMFRINPFKASRVDNFMPNKHVKASVRTKPITVSQPHVITKKDVHSITNGFSPKNVESTTRTRRPQPRNNPKNDKVPSKSKSSCLSNKLKKIKENHRSLQSSNYPDHMLSECMDKSKITRKQSKASKHGHENQKSTKPKPQKTKALANFHLQGPILQFPKVIYNLKERKEIQGPNMKTSQTTIVLTVEKGAGTPFTVHPSSSFHPHAILYDYIGGQPSSAPRTALAAQAPQVLQTPTATTTTADTAPTPTNSSSQATNCPNSSQDVDELETQHMMLIMRDVKTASRVLPWSSILRQKVGSWSSKKQELYCVSSPAEAEYVSLSACCAQVLWMRTQLTNNASLQQEFQSTVIQIIP